MWCDGGGNRTLLNPKYPPATLLTMGYTSMNEARRRGGMWGIEGRSPPPPPPPPPWLHHRYQPYHTCSWTDPWIYGINVKAQVDWSISHHASHFLHQRRHGLVPALLYGNSSDSLHWFFFKSNKYLFRLIYPIYPWCTAILDNFLPYSGMENSMRTHRSWPIRC